MKERRSCPRFHHFFYGYEVSAGVDCLSVVGLKIESCEVDTYRFFIVFKPIQSKKLM